MLKQAMRDVVYFGKPVLTGVLVALPLFTIMWLQIGSIYAQGYSADSFGMMQVGMLFKDAMLIPTLVIAFLAGMASGAVSAKQSETDAAIRGGMTAAFFAVFVAMPTIVAASGRGDAFLSSLTGPKPVWAIPLILLAIVLLAGVAILGSLECIVTAAFGGTLGRRLINWRRWSFYSLSVVLSVVAVLYIIHYGSVSRSVFKALQPEMAVIKRQVEQNLIKTSDEWTWRTRLKVGYPPRVDRITCDSRNGLVTVKMSPEKKFQSAHLSAWMPRSARRVPDNKAEAVKMLQELGVREPLLRTLKEERGTWRSKQGRYSVVLSINYD